MTDKQHDDLETVGHDDHDLQGEAVQAETWQEDQPPVDDFHDQAEVEPVAAEIEDVEPITAEEAAPASGSGMKIMIGALGVGAVFIAGLLYLQFGTTAEQTPLAMPIAQVMKVGQPMTPPEKSVATLPPPNAAANQDGNPVDPATAPKTAEADMNSIYNAGHANDNTEAVAMPTLQAPPGEAPVTLPPVAPDNSAPVPPPLPDLTPAMPAVKTAAAPPQVVAPVAPVAAPVVPVMAAEPVKAAPVVAVQPAIPVVAISKGLAEARLNDLAVKLDHMQKAIEQSAQQTTLLAGKVDAAVRAPVAPVVSAGLESRLTEIEHKLAALAARKEAARPAPVAPVATTPAIEVPVVAPPADKVAAVQAPAPAAPPAPVVAKPAKPRHVVAKPVMPHRTAPVAAVAARHPAPPAQTWVLRAATPDSAWISKDASSANLTKVQVGDDVDGIGKVQSISQTGDSWSIVGSSGVIR